MDREIQNMFTAIQKRLESIDKKYGNDPKPVYLYSKTAYIDDTEVVFTGVPQGSLAVYFESNGGYPNYNVSRNGDRVTITFEPLEYIGTVTISVQ